MRLVHLFSSFVLYLLKPAGCRSRPFVIFPVPAPTPSPTVLLLLLLLLFLQYLCILLLLLYCKICCFNRSRSTWRRSWSRTRSRQRSRSRSWTKKGSGRLRLCLNPSVTITTFVAVDFHKKTVIVGKERCRKGGIWDGRDSGLEGYRKLGFRTGGMLA